MIKLTIVESPFSTDREGVYLKRCLADAWKRGEIPFASHAFFPQFLNEDDPAERRAGIEAGYVFWHFAKKVVFYIDQGMSPGMRQAKERLDRRHVLPYEMRFLDKADPADAQKPPG